MHPVFHVSILKKYHGDGNYIIRWNSALLDENFVYEEEPIAILDIHIFLQIRVLFLALVFLPVIVRGRTMGKLVSIVTTCLVVLSSRVYFW